MEKKENAAFLQRLRHAKLHYTTHMRRKIFTRWRVSNSAHSNLSVWLCWVALASTEGVYQALERENASHSGYTIAHTPMHAELVGSPVKGQQPEE